jgi:hypothetical protein
MRRTASWTLLPCTVLLAAQEFGFWIGPHVAAAEEVVQQVIDFETDCDGNPLVAGQLMTQICGDGGAGPILVSGRLGVSGAGNVAILFDTADPTGTPIDDDLGSPNEACPGGGPGVGAGGEPGATLEGHSTENCPASALGLVLIVAENLDGADGDGIADDPDDADVAGSLLRLDFSEIGPVMVTAMKLMDVESEEQPAVVRFYADSLRQDLLGVVELPRTGDNGLVAAELGKNTGVMAMEITLNGSGAIDDIVFAFGPCPPGCDDGNACTADACDPLTGECLHDPVACDDGDACTLDECDPQTGQCASEPIDCGVGEPCAPRTCIDGECVDQPVNCDDGDACTLDECDPQTGECLHAGIDCDDSDPCHPFVCVDGACVSAPQNCDDGDPCTIDTCVDGQCVQTPDEDCVALNCRVTGGANGQEAGDGNRYHGSGQAGAPGSAFGEWTHHQKNGPDGKFIFHAGTASAPEETHIQVVQCSDPGFCEPARPAPAKQIDFEGVGTFKNIQQAPPALQDIEPGETLHWFEVHIEDLGEPGDRGGPGDGPDGEDCPPDGSAGELASCECPDFYRIVIYAAFESGAPPNTTDVIYRVSEYVRDGNYQIHPALD